MTTDVVVQGLDDIVAGPSKKSAELDLEGLNPDIKERINLMRQDWKTNKKFNPSGTDLPISSGARTRKQQEELYSRYLKGDKNVFSPINPADFPDKKYFHEDAIDLPAYVPDKFLEVYGLHRPLGKKDPVHVAINPNIKWQRSGGAMLDESGDIVVPGLEDVKQTEVDMGDWKPGFTNPNLVRQGERSRSTLGGKPGAMETLVTDIAKPLSEISPEDWRKKSLAAPVLGYLAGSDPILRGLMPERTEKMRNLYGPILEQKGENLLSGVSQFAKEPWETTKKIASAVANTSLGTLIGEGVKGTVYDPEALLLGGPTQKVAEKGVTALGKVGTKLGQVAEETVPGAVAEAKTLAGQVTRRAKGIENNLDRWNDSFLARKQAALDKGLINDKGMPNVGAAMTTDAANLKATMSLASPDIQQSFAHLTPDRVNIDALNRHNVADKFGINLTKGEATQNPALLGKEWNLRGASNDLMTRLNERNPKLYQGMNDIRERVAPDIYDYDIRNLGQHVVDDVLAKDKVRLDNIKNAYQALEQANGGQFPIDTVKLGSNIDKELKAKLKSNYYSDNLSAIKKDIDELVKGGNMTFEQFENLRTNLANEMRSNSNGNARAAAYIVRNELEKLPMPDSLKTIKPLADEARRLVTERSNVLKTNPAYRNIVKDTRDLAELESGLPHVSSDKLIDKFIYGNSDTASRANVQRLINEIGADSKGAQAIRAGTINKLREASRQLNPSDVFAQKGFRNALDKNLGSKKDILFDQNSIKDLNDLADVASWTEHAGGTKTANTSNTLSAAIQEFGVPAARSVARAKTQGLSDVAEFALGKFRQKRDIENILKRGAGIEKD